MHKLSESANYVTRLYKQNFALIKQLYVPQLLLKYLCKQTFACCPYLWRQYMGEFHVDFREKSGGLRRGAPQRMRGSPSWRGLSVGNARKIQPARPPSNFERAISGQKCNVLCIFQLFTHIFIQYFMTFVSKLTVFYITECEPNIS
jgi:hypothetical protein